MWDSQVPEVYMIINAMLLTRVDYTVIHIMFLLECWAIRLVFHKAFTNFLKE